jgi:hypothetical protein
MDKGRTFIPRTMIIVNTATTTDTTTMQAYHRSQVN